MVSSVRCFLSSVVRVMRLRQFSADERGVSAVEFALLLPFMLTVYLGGVQLSQGIGIDRKVTLTARTVADLVAQVSSIDSAGVNTVLNAATAVMSPYADSNANASKLKVTVSVVKIDANSKASVVWSKSKNGSPHGTNEAVTLPPNLVIPNTYLVWGEASYAYAPPLGYVLTGTLNLSDKIYMRPRLSETVTCPNNCT